MTHCYNKEERELSREIKSLLQLASYHERAALDKRSQAAEVRRLLDELLRLRGL